MISARLVCDKCFTKWQYKGFSSSWSVDGFSGTWGRGQAQMDGWRQVNGKDFCKACLETGDPVAPEPLMLKNVKLGDLLQ